MKTRLLLSVLIAVFAGCSDDSTGSSSDNASNGASNGAGGDAGADTDNNGSDSGAGDDTGSAGGDTGGGDTATDDDTSVDPDAAQECTPNARECFGSSIFTCNSTGTGYLAPIDCDAGEFCREGVCIGQVCEPGGALCEDRSAFKVCLPDGSGYSVAMACNEGTFCQFGACLAQTCAPGATDCTGNAVATCNDDGSGYDPAVPCGDGEFCEEGACAPRVCAPSEAICDGDDARRVCNPEGSDYGNPQRCENNRYCDDGVCVAQVCQPGAVACEGEAVVTCDERGAAWSAPVDCGDDELCQSGSCLSSLCEPGSRVCSGDGVLTCVEGGNGYGPPVPCDGDEFCQGGACVAQVCAPRSRSCDGQGRVEICNLEGSGYGAPVACEASQYCNEGFCLEQVCAPRSSLCEGNGVRTCDAQGAGYGAPVACGAEQTCDDGACLDNVCEPQVASCQGNGVVVCNAEGTGYTSPVLCSAGFFCEGGACQQGECAPNSVACEGNGVITCDARGSAWSAPVSCGAGMFCEGGECMAQVCQPNATTCDGAFAYHICDANGSDYGDSQACGNGRFCQGGLCMDQICTPSMRECVSQTTARTCRADGGGWETPTTCNSNFVCNAGTCVNPSDIPNPTIQVAFVRPQQGATREMTQGETLRVLVNAVYPGGALTAVDLLLDGEVYATDAELPYEFDFTIDEDALTGTSYTLVARARGTDNRHNVSEPATIVVRNDVPIAAFTATVAGDRVVVADASASSDRETTAEELEVRWDFENDGTYGAWSAEKVASFTYPDYGTYTIAVQVRDGVGQTASTTRQISFSDIAYIGGTIDTSTTWYGTIVITGDIVIPSGVTVTVEPGTRVLFVYQDTQPADGVGDYGITVQSGGSLVVDGTVDDPALFTVYGDENRQPRAWAGVLVQSGGSAFTGAIFEYGDLCLDLRDDAALNDVIVRTCHTGVHVAASGATWDNVEITGNLQRGLVADGNATFTAAELAAHNNGAEGVYVSGSAAPTLNRCAVHDNASHGVYVNNASPVLDDCAIHDNGQAGVNYQNQRGGTLTHSNITDNGAEGVRVEVTSSGPTIQWNNIHGNAVTGGWRFRTLNTAAQLTWMGSACCTIYRVSPNLTVPDGGFARRANVSYDENDSNGSGGSYITGGLRSGTEILWSTNRDFTGWVDLTAALPQTFHVYVYDSGWGSTQSITASEIVYAAPAQSGVELTVNALSTTVDARYNYLGVFPDVLSAVSMTSPTAVNVQGFVGVPFDESFDPGPYVAGTIDANTVLSGTIYITGDTTVAAGTTLTVEPGTRVLFVRHDQDNNGVGDFTLDVAGALRANGSANARVLFDGVGAPPAEEAYEVIRLRGAGSVLDYVDIAHGLNNLEINASNALVDHARISAAGSTCVLLQNTAAATLQNSDVTDCGEHGVQMIGGSATFSRVQALRNADAGLLINGGSANATLSDSTLRYNEGDGAAVYGPATINFNYNHFGDNSNGVELGGAVSGQVTWSNISFNDREGLLVYRRGASTPTAVINNNNIFSNAVTEGLQVASLNTAAQLTWMGSACCTIYRVSSDLTVPDGGFALWANVSYDENDSNGSGGSYITGGLRSGSNVLWTTNRDFTGWVDLTAALPQTFHVYVYDSGWGSTQRITASDIIHGHVTAQPLAMTAFTPGNETINARSNWWGGSLNPASLVSQYPVGLVDYSGFTGSAYTVGPR